MQFSTVALMALTPTRLVRPAHVRPEKRTQQVRLSSNWFSNSSQWHEQPGFLNLAEFEVVVIQVVPENTVQEYMIIVYPNC